MFVAVVGRHRAKDHANLLEVSLVGRQHPARNAGGVASLSRLGVAPIDRPVGIECRAQRDVEQAALAACIDGWHASNRLPQLTRCRDDAQAAGLLCDQQVAAGERLHGPRVLESLREHADIEGDVRLDRARACLAGERRALVWRVRLACFERHAGGRAAGNAVARALRPGIVRGHAGALAAGRDRDSQDDHRDEFYAGSTHGPSQD